MASGCCHGQHGPGTLDSGKLGHEGSFMTFTTFPQFYDVLMILRTDFKGREE